MKSCFNCANNCSSEDKCLEENKNYASYGKDCKQHRYYIDTRDDEIIPAEEKVNLITMLEDFFIENFRCDRQQGNIKANMLLDRFTFCKLEIKRR